MQAVYEHEELERRAWLSTEARAALPDLRALADHGTPGPTLVRDDDVFSALTFDERPGEDLDTAGAPAIIVPALVALLRAIRANGFGTRAGVWHVTWESFIDYVGRLN